MVEIAKALSLNARVIIMDEPTSSLTLTETERLLRVIAELRAQGVSIIYISHRLGEVCDCADRVEVLRDGKNAGGLARNEISHETIVSKMVGREIKTVRIASEAKLTPGFLKVRAARSARFPGHEVSFDAGRGEILGLLITRRKMQLFIVTLCGLLIYRGVARYIADDATKGFGSGTGFATLRSVASGKFLGLPMPFVILITNQVNLPQSVQSADRRPVYAGSGCHTGLSTH